MTREEFIKYYDMTPERAKKTLEFFNGLVNDEVRAVIEHFDFYENPTDYCNAETLKEKYGEDAFEKGDDSNGYPNLYDYQKDNSAVSLFMSLISCNTTHGGYTSAMEACRLMGIE